MDLEAVPLAKITPPFLSGVFPRKRLFRLIDNGRKSSIIWVSAPAGSGKTTLVASYLNARKLPSLWYHIDEGDADIAAFFYHLGLATKKASPRRRRPLPLFTREYMTGLSTFATRYFENLYARFHSPAVIVLDNYQDIPLNSPLHEVIRFGLACIPEGITVILISRHDPPISLVTLRSKGICIIGWEDLRLTSDESCGIVQLRAPGRNKILKDMIAKFHCRAHGWVAGLILMLEQARLSGPNRGPSMHSNQDVIFDYFAREIFQKVDHETRDFLLKASFLPHITPHSAGKLTGNHQAENILSILAQGNWFTFRYTHRGFLYQFHPLFREFLQESANTMFGFQEIMEIKCLAAELLIEEGETEAAAQLLHEAGSYQKLSEVIMRIAPMLIQQGRYQTLESYMHGMPGEFLEKDPWLLYWLGASRIPFHLAGARESFEKAFSIFQTRGDPAGLFLSWSSIVDTIIHEWADYTSLGRWIETLGQLLQQYPAFPSEEIEGRVTNSAFCAMMFERPESQDITSWERRVLSLVRQSQDCNQRILMGNRLIYYHLWITGNHSRAGMVFNLIRPEHPSRLTPFAHIAWHTIESGYYGMTSHRDLSQKTIEKGFRIAETTGIHTWDFMLYVNQISLCLCYGDLAAARRYLNEISSRMDRSQRLNLAHYHYLASWAAWLEGDKRSALEHAEMSVELSERFGGPFNRGASLLALSYVLHACGKRTDATPHLLRAIQIFRKMKNMLFLHRGLLLQALIAMDTGDDAGGLDALREAFSIMREQGYRIFSWWHPDMMARLCARALEKEIEVDYVQRLIREKNLTLPPSSFHVESWPWPLKIYTLGRFAIVKEGKPIRFTGKAQRRPLDILKVLIALGGRNVREERIIDLLWSESNTDAAHSAFTSNLSRLRKLIGHEAIRVSGGHLTLNPEYCWVDVWALERLLTQAEETNTPIRFMGEVRGATLDTKILRLCRGPFMGSEEEAPWTLSYREKLRSRLIRYISKRWCHLGQMGHYEEAITLLQKGIEVDPLAEELYRALIASYISLGRSCEAMSVYHRCRKVLSTHMETEPSPETEALYKKLRNKENFL